MKCAIRLLLPAVLISAAIADERAAWKTSRLSGSPEPPPPFVAEAVWPELTFDGILDIALLEPEGALFLMARRGRILTIPADLSGPPPKPELNVDLKAAIPDFLNNRGIVFHPRFPEKREVFLHYIAMLPDKVQRNRFSRFLVDENLRIDPATEEVLLTTPGGGHSGGNMQFGPDGMLYFGLGDIDAPSPPDHKLVGQDVSNLASTICRIDIDRRDPGKAYAVPKDNPFVSLEGALPEIWAFGFRNPWKLCFDPADGSLWTGDVGWELWEMIYRVERGANYGWSMVEGPAAILPNQDRGPAPISPPTHAYSHIEGASVTGGFFVESDRIPELRDSYLYGDFVTGKMWALRHENGKVTSNREIADTRKQIVTFGQLPDGDLIFMDWENGQHLYRLVPNPRSEVSTDFPSRLSETGLFADIAGEKPAAGVYEFRIKAPMWQDGASSRYWLGLPGTGTIATKVQKRRNSPLLTYEKPDDAVLAKTISVGDKRIETQILHYDGYWKGYTYRWTEGQDDAHLVPKEGGDGIVNGKPWRFHSRAECIRCHGSNFNRPLAFFPGQLDFGGQLDRLRNLGLVDKQFVEAAEFQPMADPQDASAPLETRARSWLHTNCASCHRISGGGALAARMNVAVPSAEMDLFDVAPMKGEFGIDDAKLIAPGDPYRSVLYYRIATRGAGHMPMIGPHTVDREGVRVVHDWIRSLAPGKTLAAPKSPPSSVPEALALHHQLCDPALPEAKRFLEAERCRESENPMILNLFYGFGE